VERNAQLDASGRAGINAPLANLRFRPKPVPESRPGFPAPGRRTARLAERGRRGERAFALLLGWLVLFLLPGQARAQCAVDQPEAARIQQLFEQQNWPEVVRQAKPLPCRPADLNFDYGLALAHLDQWPEARRALVAGERESPRQKRFPIELAGVAFERKRYPEAAAWLQRALKIDRTDEYVNNFAGSVYFLMGNLEAALKYWNRIRKPSIAAFDFDPHLRVQRLLLDRAFAFSPAAVLKEADFETTETRLTGLGIFPTSNIALNARPDGSFDAEFRALERDGFGSSRMQALVSTFAGAAYETIYPAYYNLGGAAANFESLLRWDSQKRRAWISLSAPLHGLPQRRWQLFADARDENWVIRRSSTGPAPVLGSLHLERQALTGSATSFTSGRLQWSAGAELSHRGYRDVVAGSALTPELVSSGYALKVLGSIDDKLLDIPERRFSLTTGASLQMARLWSSPPRLFTRLQGSALAHWLPQAEGDRYEAAGQLRAGRTFGVAPFDELFMLGEERDNDLWLCGQVGTRDGRKGSSPLGYDYFLSNASLLRSVYSNGLLGIKAGPLFDIGRMGAPTGGLSTTQWIFDAGAEVRFTVLGTSVVMTYGRDLRTGNNAFYGAAAHE
jgi:tetratricopeptide (TPR) repeat protein